jgi:uncharacterized OB-fold protein
VLEIGTRVRAVWKDISPGTGTLDDIEYFEPVTEPNSLGP